MGDRDRGRARRPVLPGVVEPRRAMPPRDPQGRRSSGTPDRRRVLAAHLKGTAMSVLTAGPSGVVDLAGRLSRDLAEGRSARQTFGTRDAAFAWAAGLPSILARHVTAAVVEGLSFDAVRVAPSGTPAGKVAEKAPKPNAVTLTSTTIPLTKYAGLASVTTEQTLSAEGLVAALAATITQSCLLAYDADCIAALAAAGGPDVA